MYGYHSNYTFCICASDITINISDGEVCGQLPGVCVCTHDGECGAYMVLHNTHI